LLKSPQGLELLPHELHSSGLVSHGDKRTGTEEEVAASEKTKFSATAENHF